MIQRRERVERPPRLEDLGHPGIGRSSLPAGLPTPRFTSDVPTYGDSSDAKLAVEEKNDGNVGGAQPMQQEETNAEEGEEDPKWTPEMIAEASLGILGADQQLQLRCRHRTYLWQNTRNSTRSVAAFVFCAVSFVNGKHLFAFLPLKMKLNKAGRVSPPPISHPSHRLFTYLLRRCSTLSRLCSTPYESSLLSSKK